MWAPGKKAAAAGVGPVAKSNVYCGYLQVQCGLFPLTCIALLPSLYFPLAFHSHNMRMGFMFCKVAKKHCSSSSHGHSDRNHSELLVLNDWLNDWEYYQHWTHVIGINKSSQLNTKLYAKQLSRNVNKQVFLLIAIIHWLIQTDTRLLHYWQQSKDKREPFPIIIVAGSPCSVLYNESLPNPFEVEGQSCIIWLTMMMMSTW